MMVSWLVMLIDELQDKKAHPVDFYSKPLCADEHISMICVIKHTLNIIYLRRDCLALRSSCVVTQSTTKHRQSKHQIRMMKNINNRNVA